MRRPLKCAAPHVAGFAWLASSVCAAAPGAASGAAIANPANPATPATSAAADARRELDTARMWGIKHRDDLARDALRKGLLIAPGDPELLAEQVRVLLRLGDAKSAQASLARLQAQSPNAAVTQRVADEYRVATSGRGEMAQIRLLARSGRADEAARRIVALFPNGAPSGALGAEYYQIVSNAPGGRQPAIAALRRAVAADPRDTSASMALARLLNQRDDTRAEANRIAWSLAKRADADHTEAMALWRRVLQSAGSDPAYLDALHAYLALAPDDTEFRDRAAGLDQQRDAQRRLERDPDYIAQQRGLQALARGDLAAADPLLARAARARPDDADALGGLGLLRLREGRHDEARALFARAATRATDQRGKWQGLARTAQFWGLLAQGREAASAGRQRDAERAARAALAMQPDNPDAKLQLADALLAQRDWARAEPLLRGLLAARSPSLSAVRDTATLYENTGRADRIGPLLDALQGRVTGADDRRTLDGLRGDVLANEARALADKGARGPAAQRYEAAVRAAPDAPWTRFALARLYRDMGLPQLGRTVMDDGLALSDTPEMRYANALYRNSLDDVAGAQAALAPVDDAHRSDGMRALARKLDAESALADARGAHARGDRAAFAATLAHAQASAPDDPDMLAAIGAQWIDAGEPERGLAPLRDWIAAHPREADADVRLRYGDLLGRAGRDDALAAWLDTLRGDPSLTPPQTARLEDQSLRLVLRQTDDAIARQDYAQARTLLDRASPAGRADKRYALELADLERAQGHYDAARDALAPVVARTPDDADTQLALARIDEDSGNRAAARERVQAVLARTPDDDVDTQLSAVRRLNALRRPDEAAQVTERLQAAYPARADVTVAAGRVAEAQGRYDDAASLYRLSQSQERATGVSPGRDGLTPAQAAFADLQQRRNPEIETGWIPAYKSGDEGISSYRAQQVPIYLQMPIRYDGHVFAQVDTVHLDPGTLDTSVPDAYSLKTFGTYAGLRAQQNPQAAALIANPPGSLHQSTTGVALGAGYLSDAWRVDLGTSPLGFPVHYLVGGVRYRFDAGPASFSVNASRRPETSSVLSYAGMRDPWTGAVWGGVRRDGVNLRASVDVGRTNLFAELGAGVLSGRNVERNAEVTLRTGFTVPVYERAAMKVSTGLVGNAWHYAQNLRYYTYGQGGYYSPQRYLSLGVPIEWAGRHDALSWDLTVTGGISNSYEKDSLYYPTLSGQRAEQVAAGFVYAGSSTRGVSFSYGVNGIAEYRVNPHLSVGAQLHIDRSHDYAPSSALVYLRYAFDARASRSWLVTPTPVRLYSDY
ncbi:MULTISPECIES: cellulose synthase subunit BcsC-related outer membrane protein [Burkholderia cepacia complex]|uniref:Cellulose synthase operon C-like protein n=7 Tax=Burkholderia TaxID=32008 RepID=A0A0H2XM95_BURO1|nr:MULTISPECIES: cellulose synthase subunit BcsC-related outer membrane protein [Burkholderia cepacia complex]EKS9843842.1 BCSC C-terminal domain-containing protein [Burkholderia cepacia]ABK08133.1 cellulose synthase operon C domain protein [Burkholderia cenocepacia HI2424]MBJ9668307.1 BCSC C-terminal domain-containing protein [Burkholderia cenocepacia]MBJ9733092.1 BCSC C-terminal domain-containing protein [Burkholderia cenocepacia]MBJ9876765.1 BCSC C-terminal domain-containing protein [Burkho